MDTWWYKICSNLNLNGNYGDDQHVKGVYWVEFRGWEYSLPFIEIKFVKFNNEQSIKHFM